MYVHLIRTALGDTNMIKRIRRHEEEETLESLLGSAHPNRIATPRVLASPKLEALSRLEEAEQEMAYLRELGAYRRNRADMEREYAANPALRGIEDRRLYNPDVRKVPKTLIGPKFRLIDSVQSHAFMEYKPHHYEGKKFELALCVRRKTRKEVLHALKKTKKGSKSKSRRRSKWSDIKC